jgi:outer membrane protein TolC
MKKLLLILIAAVAYCPAALSLTWSEALSIAEQNSNQLKSAQIQVDSSEWSYRRAISVFLPQLSASARMSENLTATGTASARSYSYDLSASQALFKGMDGIYGIQSAYSGVENSKAGLAATKASVFYDLRSAFIDLLIAQENIKLNQEILKRRRENSQLIQLRYDSGKEDKGNLLTTKADEKSAQYDLSSSERDLSLKQLRLSQLLQHEVSQVEDPREAEEPQTVDFDGLLLKTPSYITAKKQLEISELSYNASISGFLPSISLGASFRKSGPDWPPEEENKSWSLSISYPFFPGGGNIAERAIARTKLEQAKEDFSLSLKELRYSLEDSFKNYQDALEALEVSKVSLSATKERARITEAKYLNGLTGYDEWYRINNNYIQAQKSLLNSKRSALLAEASWHKSYGGYVK